MTRLLSIQIFIRRSATRRCTIRRAIATRVGMSGHSFCAVTTQAVTGETFLMSGTELTDPRIRAAVIMSPSTPKSETAEGAFGDVKIPWLLMTGTKEVAPFGGMDAKERLTVYPALHRAPKYQIVLDNADHSVFADRAVSGDRRRRTMNHHRVIRALSTAFCDAYLQENKDALAWLDGTGRGRSWNQRMIGRHRPKMSRLMANFVGVALSVANAI